MTRRLFFAVLAGAPMIRPKARGMGVWFPEFGRSDPYRMTRAVTRGLPAYVECDETFFHANRAVWDKMKAQRLTAS